MQGKGHAECDRRDAVRLEHRIREEVPLAPYTTFQVGGAARYFLEAEDELDIEAALGWADEARVPVFVLGGGSNLLVKDEGFRGLVLRVSICGVAHTGCTFDVGAGESWDALVDQAIAAGCAGMECLAGIPGSVGATPVQNVGAYGQEVAQTVESVRAFDRMERRFLDLPAAACGFGYRKSVFNTAGRDRYIVTRVRFALREGGAPELRYPDLQHYFAERAALPTLAQVAEAVRTIRRRKAMVVTPGDPDTQSAGSYFKNPVIRTGDLPRIAEAAGVALKAVPAYPAGEGLTKLSAAWLVEGAGFRKGFQLGRAGLSTKHSLALTNRGGASFAEIQALERRVQEGVRERFGLELEREPVLLDVAG